MIFTGKAGGFMAEIAKLFGDIRGIEFVPIKFEVAKDLAYWSAEIPGKVVARAEALTGPMTPPGKRVQTLNAPGSETGPGTVATWGRALANEVDAMGFKFDSLGLMPFNPNYQNISLSKRSAITSNIIDE